MYMAGEADAARDEPAALISLPEKEPITIDAAQGDELVVNQDQKILNSFKHFAT